MGSVRARLGQLLVALALGVACTAHQSPPAADGPTSTPHAPSVTPSRPGPTSASPTEPGTPDASPTATVDSVPATERERRLLVVWVRGELPGSTVAAVTAVPGVAAVAPVGEGTMWLGGPTDNGARGVPAIPIDAAAAAPADLRAVLGPRPWLRDLGQGGAVLSTTSAALRRAEPGDTLRFGQVGIPVGAVVADREVGAHEVFLSTSLGRSFGIGGADYLLVRIAPDADPATTEAAVEGAATAISTQAVRVRSQAETAYLRQGDGVMPPEWTKVYFGEFAAVQGGDSIAIDPAWVRDHIATERVPILGEVTCNRAFLAPLRATLRAVEEAGASSLVDPSHFGGCFAARLIRGSTSQLSQHAYGAAIDINVSGNLLGAVPTQDPRLVRAFAERGFVWGGDFLLPDGMHFEYGCPAVLALEEQTKVPERLAGLALCRGA
jgi:hypothetical protein